MTGCIDSQVECPASSSILRLEQVSAYTRLIGLFRPAQLPPPSSRTMGDATRSCYESYK